MEWYYFHLTFSIILDVAVRIGIIFFTLMYLKISAYEDKTPASNILRYNKPVLPESVTTRDLLIGSFLCMFVFLLIRLFFSVVRDSRRRHVFNEIYSLISSSSLSIIGTWSIVSILKKMVSAYRPDYLTVCTGISNYTKWQFSNECITSAKISYERSSFPSGHAACAFGAVTLSVLYLTSCFHMCSSLFKRTMKILSILIIVPLYLTAFWVACTRVQNNRHHIEDVIVGGIIGIAISVFAYVMSYKNGFPNMEGIEEADEYESTPSAIRHTSR